MSVTRPTSTIAIRLAALGNDTRLKILRFLVGRRGTAPVSVKELTRELGITQPTASRHIATLRSAGLVAAGEKGKGYTIDRGGLIEAVHDAEHCTGFDELSPVLQPLKPMFDECVD